MIKKYAAPALCILFILLASIPAWRYISRQDRLTKNNIAFQKAAAAVETGVVSFNELVPFEWDALYIFYDSASKSQLEAALGFASGSVRELNAEGQRELIFVRDRQVVSCIVEMEKNAAYAIRCSSSPLLYSDNALFNVVREDGRVLLTLQEPQE